MVPTDSCGVTNFQIRQCNNIQISLCHRIILDGIYCRLQTLLSEEFSLLSSSDLIIHAVHAQHSLLLPFHLWRLSLFQGCSALKHVQTHTCSGAAHSPLSSASCSDVDETEISIFQHAWAAFPTPKLRPLSIIPSHCRVDQSAAEEPWVQQHDAPLKPAPPSPRWCKNAIRRNQLGIRKTFI